MNITNGATELPSRAWAVQTRLGEGFDIAIALPVDKAFLPVLDRAVKEMQDRRPTKRNLRFVDLKNEHEVAVYKEGDNAVFELTDQAWVTEGLKRLSHKVPLDRPDILYTVFSCFADFFYHLRRSSKADLKVSVYEIKQQQQADHDTTECAWSPVLKDKKEMDLNQAGIIRIEVHDPNQARYGFKLSSSFKQAVYVWAFVFNMSDMSIVMIYQPSIAKRSNSVVDPCILPDGDLTIGYGSGGGKPMGVWLGDDADVDVSYIKFFITSKYVDLSNIEQGCPFPKVADAARLAGPSIPLGTPSPVGELYGTFLLTLVSEKGAKKGRSG